MITWVTPQQIEKVRLDRAIKDYRATVKGYDINYEKAAKQFNKHKRPGQKPANPTTEPVAKRHKK